MAQFKKTIELFPDAPSPRNNLADVYEAKGMYSGPLSNALSRSNYSLASVRKT
ncbi:MAG: hypothetical protein IPG58_17590 [Acidobacteria bacterium]|nr:hypothetical protein [Acidobacteriota bacterium]